MNTIILTILICVTGAKSFFVPIGDDYKYAIIPGSHLIESHLDHYIQPSTAKERTPSEVMIDLTNDLTYRILHFHSILNRNNFAFSPTALMSVLVALYEGAMSRSAMELKHVLYLPNNRDIIRIGYRDIHRRLRVSSLKDICSLNIQIKIIKLIDKDITFKKCKWYIILQFLCNILIVPDQVSHESCQTLHIFNNILLNRINDWLIKKDTLYEYQAGFRKNYSTVDNIFNLVNINDLSLLKSKYTYAFFVNFSSALDILPRNSLIYKLSKYGLSSKIIRILQCLYDVTDNKVWDENTLSSFCVLLLL